MRAPKFAVGTKVRHVSGRVGVVHALPANAEAREQYAIVRYGRKPNPRTRPTVVPVDDLVREEWV